MFQFGVCTEKESYHKDRKSADESNNYYLQLIYYHLRTGLKTETPNVKIEKRYDISLSDNKSEVRRGHNCNV